MTESELTKINGVGKKRAAELLVKFKNIQSIAKADVGELSEILPQTVAEEVYNYYRREE